MDLTREFPRSPRERLIGLPMLPRAIDKARAALAGTLGEYVYGDKSPFDMTLLGFLGLTPERFLEGVRLSPDDEGMVQWLRLHARKASDAEAEAFARDFLDDGDDDADRARFAERRAKLPEHVRSRVTGWVDLLDVAEGRIT
jgi:hypothetical protein